MFELCRITGKCIALMQNQYETCGHAYLQGKIILNINDVTKQHPSRQRSN
jgi:hypothetical protein